MSDEQLRAVEAGFGSWQEANDFPLWSGLND
jgi:hypothetical protein